MVFYEDADIVEEFDAEEEPLQVISSEHAIT